MPETNSSEKTIRKYPLLKIALIVLAAVGLSTLLWFVFASDKTPTDTTTRAVITYSTENPDENKPSESFVWSGFSSDPKFIRLPSIAVEGYIQNVGVDQNQEIAVPNNIHKAGWFVDSVLPGEKGLSIIDGHLNGRQNDGIFLNLEAIEKDAIFSVEFGDGSIKEFKVLDVVTVPTSEAADILYSQIPELTNQLNLITCGGEFDQSARLYDKRVIVRSTLIL